MKASEQITKLQDELVSYAEAGDQDAVRRAFRELLNAGCSRQEIVTKLLEASQAADQTPNAERDEEPEAAKTEAQVSGSAQEPAGSDPEQNSENVAELPATPEPASEISARDEKPHPAISLAEPAEPRPEGQPNLAVSIMQGSQKPDDTNEVWSVSEHKDAAALKDTGDPAPTEAAAAQGKAESLPRTSENEALSQLSPAAPEALSPIIGDAAEARGPLANSANEASSVGGLEPAEEPPERARSETQAAEEKSGASSAVDDEHASSGENATTEIPISLFGNVQPRRAEVVVEEARASTPERLMAKLQLHPLREAFENLQATQAAALGSRKPGPLPRWTARAALWLVVSAAGTAGAYFLWNGYGHEIERTVLASTREVATWLQSEKSTAKTSGEVVAVAIPEPAASPNTAMQRTAEPTSNLGPAPAPDSLQRPAAAQDAAAAADTPAPKATVSSAPTEAAAAMNRALATPDRAGPAATSARQASVNAGPTEAPPPPQQAPAIQARPSANSKSPVDNSQTASVAVPGRTEAAPQQSLSPSDLADLVSRGDQLLATRDIVNARLFYERAAASGNALGALRLGMSFDPGFVAQFGLQKTFGDPAQAISWYQRARGLGHPDADGLLARLKKK